MSYKFLLLGFFLYLVVSVASAVPFSQPATDGGQKDSVKVSVDYLKYFLQRQGNWYPKDANLERSLNSLIHFVEDEKIDSVLVKLENNQP